MWIPSHTDIMENERAGELTKEAIVCNPKPSVSDIKQMIKNKIFDI